GFGGAPKFPTPATLRLLLREHRRTGNARALEMVTRTLDRMASGGIYDHLGGGFHRYATDEKWLVPHFEKMLYDNALLARTYIEAWQVTGKEMYRRTAVETLEYVLRDLTDSAGGFHSAEDADSEGVEGKFYVWTSEEIREVLGEDHSRFFRRFYGVTDSGNFEGKSILNIKDPEQLEDAAMMERLEPLRRRLFEHRQERIRPGKDDKVLAAWNGLMIGSLACAARALDDDRYLQAARRAADFVLANMSDRNGRLYRLWREGKGASQPAYSEDYAEMINGLVELYQASFDTKRLDEADRLARALLEDFEDDEGGFFMTSPAYHRNVLVHAKPFYDGPTPSANSAAVLALVRLGRLTGETEFDRAADRAIKFIEVGLSRSPRAFLDLLAAVSDFRMGETLEVVFVGDPEEPGCRDLLDVARERFLPHAVVALLNPDTPEASDLRERFPVFKGRERLNGTPAAYVCENYSCRQPVSEPEDLAKMLDRRKGFR
ncbi:thioredoxin domain-containing protein, partial [bacterium]|nr:thioredoxin domain-containing protein [bacterium]